MRLQRRTEIDLCVGSVRPKWRLNFKSRLGLSRGRGPAPRPICKDSCRFPKPLFWLKRERFTFANRNPLRLEPHIWQAPPSDLDNWQRGT